MKPIVTAFWIVPNLYYLVIALLFSVFMPT